MKLSIFLALFLGFFPSEEKSALDRYADKLRIDHQRIEDAIIAVAREEGLISGTRALAQISRDSFDAIISGLTPREQNGMYELMRRPDILKTYAIPNLNESEIKFIFRNYPPQIGENAAVFHNEHLEKLIQLAQLSQYVDEKFNKVLFGYPYDAQEAMKFLVKVPQILEMLMKESPNKRLARVYKEHPDVFVYVIDSISRKISKEYNASIDEWKKELEADSAALKAFEEAAGIYETHLEVKEETHNQTMMAKNNQPYEISDAQQKSFQQYGTHRSSKNSKVHVSVWVGAGYGFGYGMPYWYGNPYMSSSFAGYNPYSNPYW
jgi:hypothetical protein